VIGTSEGEKESCKGRPGGNAKNHEEVGQGDRKELTRIRGWILLGRRSGKREGKERREGQPSR